MTVQSLEHVTKCVHEKEKKFFHFLVIYEIFMIGKLENKQIGQKSFSINRANKEMNNLAVYNLPSYHYLTHRWLYKLFANSVLKTIDVIITFTVVCEMAEVGRTYFGREEDGGIFKPRHSKCSYSWECKISRSSWFIYLFIYLFDVVV